jgi:hypothetical protein
MESKPGVGALKATEEVFMMAIAAKWRFKSVDEVWERAFEPSRSSMVIESAEDARIEFLSNWEKVRFPAGCSPLDAAMEQAKARPLTPPTEWTAGYGLFISLAGHLQAIQGDRPILLPCRKLGQKKYLGCAAITVSRYRDQAVRDGLLAVTREHSFIRGKVCEATEFRFDVSRYPSLLAPHSAEDETRQSSPAGPDRD